MQIPCMTPEKFIFLVDQQFTDSIPGATAVISLEHRWAWVSVFSINGHSTPRYVPSGLLALSPLTAAGSTAAAAWKGREVRYFGTRLGSPGTLCNREEEAKLKAKGLGAELQRRRVETLLIET